MVRTHWLILLVLLGSFVCLSGMAEQKPPSEMPDAPLPNQQTNSAPESQNTLQGGVAMVLTLQKKSLIFPDLATGSKKLSGWDKCKIAANTSVAPSTIGAALLGSAIGEARNVPSGYGGEIGGYGKRFVADLARSASYNAFGPCLIATATHEDPRFFVRDQLGFFQSLQYAAVRLVVTRNDEGKQVVNYSGLAGSLAAEALADSYYPAGSRDIKGTLIRYGIDMATRYGGHLLRQYLPRIDRRLKLSPQPSPADNGSLPAVN
jgi:hypothetical protein